MFRILCIGNLEIHILGLEQCWPFFKLMFLFKEYYYKKISLQKFGSEKFVIERFVCEKIVSKNFWYLKCLEVK